MTDTAPSRARNFFGRVVDRILPGQNYNQGTGRYSNVGTGIAGAALRGAAAFFGGPLVGAGAGRLINNWLTNRQQPGAPQMGGIAQPGVSVPNVGMRPGTSLGFSPPNYGPYMGNWQPPTQPTISGRPNTQTGYGVSLPNFGPMPQGRGNIGAGGARGAFGFSGYASPAHRAASIQAAQDAMRAGRNTATGDRQMHNYVN